MKHKNPLIILLAFLLYAFLLTPLGEYKYPERRHSGFYNVQKIDAGDDTGFYAYVRSGVIDGDFDFFNEKRFWHFDVISPAGYTVNYWYIGAAILWLPFFLMGHGVAWIYRVAGFPVAVDGYSFPYYSFTFAGSACEVFIALLLCYHILRKLFSREASLTATILIFSATCLPYFAFIRNRMSHSGDLLAAFAFFGLFMNLRERIDRPPWFYLLLGTVAGMLADLRYISVVYCVLPLGVALKTLMNPEIPAGEKQKLARGAGLAVLAFAIAFSPQLATWKMLHGVFSSMNPFTVVLQPNFSSLMGSVGQLFFSGTRGLAFTEPVWILGLIGLAMLLTKDRWLGGLCWLVFLGFSVAPIVIGDPATFGQRYLIPAFPVLALGLAQLAEPLFQKRLHGVVWVASATLVLWLYVLLLNVPVLEHNHPHFALQAFRNIPQLIANGSLIWPTSYPDLILRGDPGLADFLDYFFLIFFPILMAGLPALSLVVFRKVVGAPEENEGFRSRAMRNFSLASLGFMTCLTVFVVARHPELPPQEKKNRLQIAAASKVLKDSADSTNMNALLLRAEEIDPNDERNHLIRADAALLKGDFQEARKNYMKAVAINENSTAHLQLERIEQIDPSSNKKIDFPSLLEEIKRRGDPTGDLHRQIGVYFLDQLTKPEEAINYFNTSIQINPRQKQAAGIKRLISQYVNQRRRLDSRGINSRQLPLLFNLILNTEVNEVRLTSFMVPQNY